MQGSHSWEPREWQEEQEEKKEVGGGDMEGVLARSLHREGTPGLGQGWTTSCLPSAKQEKTQQADERGNRTQRPTHPGVRGRQDGTGKRPSGDWVRELEGMRSVTLCGDPEPPTGRQQRSDTSESCRGRIEAKPQPETDLEATGNRPGQSCQGPGRRQWQRRGTEKNELSGLQTPTFGTIIGGWGLGQ